MATWMGTVAVWQLAWLQGIEFALYDHYLEHASIVPSHPPVTLVVIRDQEMRSLGYPLSDEHLVQLLQRLANNGPRVIGLDSYRDLPEPRSGVGMPALSETLLRQTNIITIYRLPDQERPGIGPPPALADAPSRIGFNNFPVDALDKKIRRGLLYAGYEAGTNWVTAPSFALQVAQSYLDQEEIWPEPGLATPEYLRMGHCEYVPLKPNDGGYVGADAAGYQCLLDFRKSDAFPTFQVEQALTGTIPPEALQDRVVLIGTRAESVRDEQLSPVTAWSRGVELQAQFIDQIIRNARGDTPLLRSVGEGWESLLAAIGCLAGALLVGGGRSVFGWLMGMLLGLGILAGLNQGGFRLHWWIPVAPAGLGLVSSSVGCAVWSWQHQRRERQLLMQLFAKHVSPEIANLIWNQRQTLIEGQRLRPQLLVATVMFTDLRGFTRQVERTSPEQLLEWLNEYTEAISNQITAQDGVIHEYLGDAVLATFGVPLPRTSEAEITADAQAAVEAALGMARVLDELNRSWVQRGCPPTAMRVGLETGPVVAGSLGSPGRLKYALVGDTVVTAARLESLDEKIAAPHSPIAHCRILVGQATWQRVQEKFQGCCLGPLTLKGRQRPVTVHHVFGRSSTKEQK